MGVTTPLWIQVAATKVYLGKLHASKMERLCTVLTAVGGLIAHHFIVTTDSERIMRTGAVIFKGFALHRRDFKPMSGIGG